MTWRSHQFQIYNNCHLNMFNTLSILGLFVDSTTNKEGKKSCFTNLNLDRPLNGNSNVVLIENN